MGSLNDRQFGSHLPYSADDGGNINDNEWAKRVFITAGTSIKSVSGETISFTAGAAGTTGVTHSAMAPILDANLTRAGNLNDTCFAWVTGTCLDNEVDYDYTMDDATQLAAMSQGDYAVDYNTGRIRYCKKTTATSDTANYSVRWLMSDTEMTLDSVYVDNVTVFSTDGSASGLTYAWLFTQDQDLSGVSEKWQGIGGWDETADRFRAYPIATDNAAMPADAQGIPIMGEYNATLPTYNDGDAAVLQLDSKGRIIVAVELNDYADDSAFTVGTDMVLGIGAMADETTPDSVDEGDIGIPRMTLDRRLHTSSSYIEDSAHSSGDYGSFALAVRNDTLGTLCDTDGDYTPLQVDGSGALHVATTETTYVDDSAFTVASDKIVGIGAMADETTPDSVDEGDIGIPRMTLDRKLHISSNYQEDTAHADGDYGTFTMAVRNDTLAALSGTDGDYSPIQVNAQGSIYVDVSDVLGATMSATNPVFAELTDGTAVVSASNPLNIQVGDGTTQAGVSATSTGLYVHPYDGTNSMPMMDAVGRAGYISVTDGTDILDVLVQDSAFGTTSKGLGIFGKYEATPTTYSDGDACPILLDANGRIVLSSDIEIGAVELKDASSDNRADINDADTARATTTHVIAVQGIDAAGNVLDTASLALESGGNLDTIAGDTTSMDALLTTIDADTSSMATDLGTIDADTGNIATYTTDIPNIIGTDGGAGPSKCISIGGTESGGNLQELLVDSDGHLQIDVLSGGGGSEYTFGTDTYLEATTKTLMAGAVRNDTLATLVDTDNEIAPLQVSDIGALYTDVSEFAGNAINLGAGAVGTGTQRITLASDDPAVVDLAAIEVLLGTIDADTSTIAGDTTSMDALLTTIDADTSSIATDASTIAGDTTSMDALLTTIDADTSSIATDASTIAGDTTAIQTAVEIMDDWDESDRCAVNLISGQTGVAGGSGANGATVQRVTVATDDTVVTDLTAIKTAVQIMDDWDNSDRCSVGIYDGTTEADVNSDCNALLVKEGGSTSYQTYEDSSFVAGDSPQTHDVNNDLGRNGTDGYIICDGTGDITVQISDSGAVVGEDSFTIKEDEKVSLKGLSIDQITVTHSGTDSAYRIFVH